ncbi:M48 family metallopeptidase [Reyranella sp. CPCC 100927]|uniref:M48 family metallopeptidase n=1 Tax=Reyranella sp. CPCC 100927 TaxID=2599616 RepID=UPI0011B7BD76|nr:M48 family metallopeptidase [Reyranella sp. CPCC 100927]TWS97866.1 M48 family metallopeptidase [Reyranella sp. CPCC 100927]
MIISGRVFTAMAVLAVVAACESAPITGRDRLVPMAEEALQMQAVTAYQEQMAKQPLSKNPEYTAMVRRVGERIAKAAENPPNGLWTAPGFKWEFNVIDKPDVINAYCLPGGKIAVYTGILPISQDEAGLAILMGHEVAHALMRHHAERLSNRTAVRAGTALAGAIVGALIGGRSHRGIGVAAGIGLAVAGNVVALSFSRDQEAEADRVGLILAAHAGYDPGAAVGFWERMKAANAHRDRPPEFFSTHPAADARIANIQRYLPEAQPYYKPSP